MKAPYTYKTLAKPSEEVLFVDKKSKFYGLAFPILYENEVNPIIERLQRKYQKANHVCYAWQTGIDQINYKVNDDGEPRNSAGIPIYGQIQSFDVTNVLIAVVRLFGGTKLGVGGLIHAYRRAAKMALDNSLIIQKQVKIELRLTFGYSILDRVMRIIKQQNLEIRTQKLEMDCNVTVRVPKKDFETLLKTLEGIQGIHLEKLF